jgi:lysozyme
VTWLRLFFGWIFARREATGQPPAPPPATPAAIPAIAKGEAPATAPLPAAAVDMVAAFEGFRAQAYLCPAKVYTIGYGTTRWGNRQPVVKGDGPITKEAARRLLENDLADAAKAVDDLVTVPLADHQRAALTSFVHNVGRGAFARSTLLMHLNAGRLDSAAGEFTRWTKAGGVVLPGLVKRRAAEAALFRGGGEPSSKA